MLSKELITNFSEAKTSQDSRCFYIDGTYTLLNGCQVVFLGVSAPKGFLFEMIGGSSHISGGGSDGCFDLLILSCSLD